MQRRGFIAHRRWHALDDFLEQFVDTLVARVDVARGPSIAPRGVNDGEIKRVIIGAEIDRPKPLDDENEERMLRLMMEAQERG